jgi:hypothetical protein
MLSGSQNHPVDRILVQLLNAEIGFEVCTDPTRPIKFKSIDGDLVLHFEFLKNEPACPFFME